ncbi:MAG: hypothetical protein VX738_15015 [Planctomycetota bacterium]|nr:hypothetical protein [Planctomycetota bacterium]
MNDHMKSVKKGQRPRSQRWNRRIGFESLEERRLLAADVFAFQNPIESLDVTFDDNVSPADVLAIINQLNGYDLYGDRIGAFLDTSGDHIVAPNDALSIINELNDAVVTTPGVTASELNGASAFLSDHFVSLPTELQGAAQTLIDAAAKRSDSLIVLDYQLEKFLDYSVENTAAIAARYGEMEIAARVIDTVYHQDLQELGGALDGIVSDIYPDSPDSVDEYPDEYNFDPNEYTDTEDAFDDLFNELDDELVDIELPQYDDVLENFDEVYQSYDDTVFEFDDYVENYLSTDEYEEFVLEGGDLGELMDEIHDAYQHNSTLEDYVGEKFETEGDLIDLIDGLLESSYIGELMYNDTAAIGGETTGSVVVLGDGSVVEIDLGDDPLLIELALKYDNATVLVEGYPEIVQGVEIPNRTVIDVAAMVGADELASFEQLFVGNTSALTDSLSARLQDILSV